MVLTLPDSILIFDCEGNLVSSYIIPLNSKPVDFEFRFHLLVLKKLRIRPSKSRKFPGSGYFLVFQVFS